MNEKELDDLIEAEKITALYELERLLKRPATAQRKEIFLLGFSLGMSAGKRINDKFKERMNDEHTAD